MLLYLYVFTFCDVELLLYTWCELQIMIALLFVGVSRKRFYIFRECCENLAGTKRLKRVLRNDPGMGVIRHADAGYEIAKETLEKNGLDYKERLK